MNKIKESSNKKNNEQKKISELITDDESEDDANYSHLKKALYYTPCGKLNFYF